MVATNRIEVKKTYKLFINGAFPRSESGRVFEVLSKKGEFIANPCLASRKDLRDSVTAARAAQHGWAKATAYNRGQILYRGEPLSGGLVVFSPNVERGSNGPLALATLQPDGTFTLVWFAAVVGMQGSD